MLFIFPARSIWLGYAVLTPNLSGSDFITSYNKIYTLWVFIIFIIKQVVDLGVKYRSYTCKDSHMHMLILLDHTYGHLYVGQRRTGCLGSRVNSNK